ncbi:MAG TPA: ADOP family duplicated permease [Thermoanaerobaculia bacterium]|nr:ADOP family duplicated permease [Thermoanaerobaculia bacterium]
MSARSELRVRLGALFSRRRLDRDLDAELAFHVEMETARAVAHGFDPAEARRRALVAFGGVTQAREGVREERGAAAVEDLARDLRIALRGLVRSPAFSAAVVLTLALGIGATTAVASAVVGVLLRPLPFLDPEELVVVWETDRASGTVHEPASVPDYLDFRERSRTLAGLAAFEGRQVGLAAPGGEPARLDALAVSAEMLALLGVEPLVGGDLPAAAHLPGAGGPPAVLLGEALWRERFAADPRIVGRSVAIDDVPAVVAGVLPRQADEGLRRVLAAADYGGAFGGQRRQRVDLWLPLRPDPVASPRDTHPIFLLGRLAAGASLDAARQELAAVAADLEAEHPENAARGTHVEPLREVVLAPLARPLFVVLAAAALVLVTACGNAAHLLLGRGVARRRETAVRVALGAAGRDLLRHHLAEAALLALGGCALGVGLAAGGLGALRALAPADLPRLDSVALDPRALLLAAALALAACLAFALPPTAQARRRAAPAALLGARAGAPSGPGGHALRSGLVVAQVALALLLTVAAALLARGFWTLAAVDPGFRAEGVLKAELILPASRYPGDFARWPAWDEIHGVRRRVVERIERLPGVEAAAAAAYHPLDRGFVNSFAVVGREAEAAGWPEIRVRQVDAGYFAALGLPRLEGRLFAAGDGTGRERVAVVNRQAARRFFAGRSPVGQRVRMWGQEWRVVGVSGDERVHGLAEAPPPALYVPLAQAPARSVVLLARTAGDPLALAPAVRAAVRAEDPALAVFGVEPLAATVAASLAEQRFVLLLVLAFAAATLALAAVGLYGLLAHRVALERHELGVRQALGATPRQVVALVLSRGARLAAFGLAAGLLLAVAGSRLVGALVFGVGPGDPTAWALAAGAVLAVSLAATLLPARRATAVEPTIALRAG